MVKVSCICCYNNVNMLHDLKNSMLGYTHFEIEWVELNNCKKKYESAAFALNHGFRQSSGDFVIFLHQDIVFDSEESLVTIINAASEGNIVGAAGCTEKKGELISSIYDGAQKERKLDTIKKPQVRRVLTCDECLLAMRRDVFIKIGGFDDVKFDGWHFYVVDITLKANLLNIPCVVVPVDIWHRSMGNKEKAWEKYEMVLRKKYKSYFHKLYYPCGHCYTNFFLFYLDKAVDPIKRGLRKKKTVFIIWLRRIIYKLLSIG